MKLKQNIGKLDRALRTLLAIGITLLYLFDIITGKLGISLMLFAIVLLITSLLNFCPLYRIFRFNSCKFDPKS